MSDKEVIAALANALKNQNATTFEVKERLLALAEKVRERTKDRLVGEQRPLPANFAVNELMWSYDTYENLQRELLDIIQYLVTQFYRAQEVLLKYGLQ